MSKKNYKWIVTAENLGFCSDGKKVWEWAFGRKKNVEVTIENVKKFIEASHSDESPLDVGWDEVVDSLISFVDNEMTVDWDDYKFIRSESNASVVSKMIRVYTTLKELQDL
jgi:hypothetical protein